MNTDDKRKRILKGRHHSPSFTPLYDMILVKPDPVPDKVGSVYVPQGALKAGHEAGPSEECFIGTVMAVGPGDKVHERRLRDGTIVRTLLKAPAPMQTKVGDRVVFPRRPSMPGGEFELKIDGEMYVMFHEQQFCFAVIE